MAFHFFGRARKFVNESLRLATRTSPYLINSAPKPHFSSLTSTPKPIFTPSKPIFTSPKPWFYYLSTPYPSKPISPFALQSSFLICRPFSTISDSKSLLIKVVCCLDLNSVSKDDYEKACSQISWRFPHCLSQGRISHEAHRYC